MSNALHRAVDELQADITRYKIEVNPDARVIIINGVARQYRQYTEKRIYLRDLKMCIKLAKEREAKIAQSKQSNLFGEV